MHDILSINGFREGFPSKSWKENSFLIYNLVTFFLCLFLHEAFGSNYTQIIGYQASAQGRFYK